MPCRNDVYEKIRTFSAEEKIKKLRRELDKLTQDLCYVCGNLFNYNMLEIHASKRLVRWHKKHMENDEKRMYKKMKVFFLKNPDLINTPDTAANMFVERAAKVHPVSEFHKFWFFDIARKISNEITNKEVIVHKIETILTKNELKFYNDFVINKNR